MAKHLNIIGRVQGVGYRFSFEMQAQTLKLSGWVRNRADGSVEAMISGDGDALEKMIAWAWHGPAGAQVKVVAVTEVDGALLTEGKFEILPTV